MWQHKPLLLTKNNIFCTSQGQDRLPFANTPQQNDAKWAGRTYSWRCREVGALSPGDSFLRHCCPHSRSAGYRPGNPDTSTARWCRWICTLKKHNTKHVVVNASLRLPSCHFCSPICMLWWSGTHLPREPREPSSDRAQEHPGLLDLTHPLPLTHKIIAQVLSLHNMPSKSQLWSSLLEKKSLSVFTATKEGGASAAAVKNVLWTVQRTLPQTSSPSTPRAAWKNYPTVIRTPSGILKVLQNWNWQIALFLFYIQKHWMKEWMDAFLCFPVYRMCRGVLISFLEQ